MGRLFWKFFIFFFLAQLTAVVGVGASIWWQVRQDELESAGVEASRPARTIVEAAATTLQYGGEHGLKQLLISWQQRPMPQVYAVDAGGGELLGREYAQRALTTATKMASDQASEAYAKRIKLSNGHEYLLFVPDQASKSLTSKRMQNKVMSLSREASAINMRAPPRPRAFYPIKPILAGALASFVFAALLAWYFSKPIKGLRNAFEQASSGKLEVRIGDAMGGRRDELADLGRDFDAMASRLGSLLQGQTRLLHHVSHELRSPLARIQMALGLARQNPEKIASSLDRIELEATRMDKMVGELLELSRIESGVVQLKKEKFVLNQLLSSIVEDAQFEAQAKQIELKLQLPDNITLQGQPDLLYRAIENVVRNAIKYGPDCSEVSISCTLLSAQQTYSLVVHDQGGGVAESELEDIFKPFVRGQSGSQMAGHGVGLAITKQVIEAHGGQVHAKNLNPNGFSVEILLPS